jgi:hypothetical protein
VFVDDVAFIFPGNAGEVRHGRTTLVGYARNSLEHGRSVHHGHMPEIELTSPTNARGIWAMSNLCEYRNRDETRRILHGHGHYHEEYLKEDGVWRIAKLELTRLRVDTVTTASTHLT